MAVAHLALLIPAESLPCMLEGTEERDPEEEAREALEARRCTAREAWKKGKDKEWRSWGYCHEIRFLISCRKNSYSYDNSLTNPKKINFAVI